MLNLGRASKFRVQEWEGPGAGFNVTYVSAEVDEAEMEESKG